MLRLIGFTRKVEGVIGKTGLGKDKFLRYYNVIKNRNYFGWTDTEVGHYKAA